MQVDHIRNDFVHIPFSTSVQEGGSFSVAEGVNFGFSRTFDEVGRFPAWNDREFPGKRRPVCRMAAPHHRKCGRTENRPNSLPVVWGAGRENRWQWKVGGKPRFPGASKEGVSQRRTEMLSGASSQVRRTLPAYAIRLDPSL